MKNLDTTLPSSSAQTPRIVIVGRANVGKSSLFNRLSHSRRAIVGDREGITVDRHELLVEDSPIESSFLLVDTGGVGASLKMHPLGAEIESAASAAITGANLVLFVVDGSAGLRAEDEQVAQWLRQKMPKKKNIPVWTIINKADRKDHDPNDFYSLGFDEYFSVSCEHNLGFSDLWERLAEFNLLSTPTEDVNFNERILSPKQSDSRILILGRPNMGKSSLINALTGNDRHVVSPVAGTTRDITSSSLHFKGYDWSIYDTAGLRRPGRRERAVEWVAGDKVKKLAKQSDIAVVVMDATEGITDMDMSICGFAMESGLSLVLAFNKWDLVESSKEQDDILWNLKRTEDLKADFVRWAPKVQISAKTGKGVQKLLPVIKRLAAARDLRVQTAKLNKVFDERIQNREHPGVDGGRRVKFYYLSQVGVNPPEFVMFTNVEASRIHFSFRRYVVNVLREEFGFEGCPLKVHFKKR